VKKEVPLGPFFSHALFFDGGAVVCTAGSEMLQCTIRYFHTFLAKISNLVSITCYMRYPSMAIYDNKYIKIYMKFNILQHRACQIDTKCHKNRKKV